MLLYKEPPKYSLLSYGGQFWCAVVPEVGRSYPCRTVVSILKRFFVWNFRMSEILTSDVYNPGHGVLDLTAKKNFERL